MDSIPAPTNVREVEQVSRSLNLRHPLPTLGTVELSRVQPLTPILHVTFTLTLYEY